MGLFAQVIEKARMLGRLTSATGAAMREGATLGGVTEQVRAGVRSATVFDRSFTVVDDPGLLLALNGGHPRFRGSIDFPGLVSGQRLSFQPGTTLLGMTGISGSAQVHELTSRAASFTLAGRAMGIERSVDVTIRQLSARHVELSIRGAVGAPPVIAAIEQASPGLLQIRAYGATTPVIVKSAAPGTIDMQFTLGDELCRLVLA